MFPAPFRVLLDANVLFPCSLRDTLLRAAEKSMYQVYWSEAILEETTRNLIAQGRMSQAQARRLTEVLERAFPEALVEGYELLIPSMQNDEKDRHVAAAALVAGAQVIVTNNLKDFKHLPPTIEAHSPDDFLLDLLDLDPAQMLILLREQAAALRNPPKTLEDLLEGLSRSAPKFIEKVREEL